MAVVAGQTTWQKNAYIDTALPLGCSPTGCGRIICRSGGIAWIVAPSCSEVSRSWNSRNDAVTTACACTTSTTWFIPNCVQLLNPGYCCRVYWDSYSYPAVYWSSTEVNATNAWRVNFSNGYVYINCNTSVFCARAFRCVTY